MANNMYPGQTAPSDDQVKSINLPRTTGPVLTIFPPVMTLSTLSSTYILTRFAQA